MNTETQSKCEVPETLNRIVRQARSLYTLPAVAAEVIQLTNNPQVDARALKQCIEIDPALTVKILRVVNSSLFGMSREVSDLNQAIALLGTKPLKLLVLGFSLPENLFREVAHDQLQWYWKTTLARAVAAREISEQLWERAGDDAFLAGLLQDIGVLVLLGELQEPYAEFLGRVIDERADLGRLERESLGFDHTLLSAEILANWNMPKLMVEAIAAPREQNVLLHSKSASAELARILHLAELLAELVAQNRLGVLPELIEAGDAYCGLDKQRLNELVASLQPKVEVLADVLSLELCNSTDYVVVLGEAHAQMSHLTEGLAELLSRPTSPEEQDCNALSAEVADLRAAVDVCLQGPAEELAMEAPSLEAGSSSPEKPFLQDASQTGPPATEVGTAQVGNSFVERLTLAVGKSRSHRQPVSVLILEVGGDEVSRDSFAKTMSQVLDVSCHEPDNPEIILETVSPQRRALVLPGYERQEAVRLANKIFSRIDETVDRITGLTHEYCTSAGVACVTLPVKNFPPMDLIETAERCLSAAQTTGSNVVKSLEIY